jgi:hypothetical protein
MSLTPSAQTAAWKLHLALIQDGAAVPRVFPEGEFSPAQTLAAVATGSVYLRAQQSNCDFSHCCMR